MNTVQSLFAATVMAFSATVSAQVVFVPNFPVEKPVQKPVETQTANADAAAETPRQEA